MDNKGILHDMGGWSQLFFFFFLFFSGLIAASFVLILTVDLEGMQHSANMMRMAQTIQTVVMLLFPALAFAYLCQNDIKTYLGTEKRYSYLFMLFAIILIIVIQPFISTISYYNQQMVLPDSLSQVEEWMKSKEMAAEKTVNLLFEERSLMGLIFNLLVIAVVAGLAEEFFFRGCLQQIVQKIVKNYHIAIWITAIIFSAIHFQFYGFVPRVLMGALLGYLFVWSGNIWVPVIVHTVHNAANVIVAHLYYKTPMYEQMENINLANNAWQIGLSVILTLICIFILYKKRAVSP